MLAEKATILNGDHLKKVTPALSLLAFRQSPSGNFTPGSNTSKSRFVRTFITTDEQLVTITSSFVNLGHLTQDTDRA